jgi:hypothetical protein
MSWLSGSNSVVECDLAKVEVAGSNPVSRSIHFEASEGGSMKKPLSSSLPGVLVALLMVLLGCGDNRSLQSVSISPTAASSKAQFTALGTYNTMPTSVDITGTTTWCIGSSNGVCAGNIAIEATVNAGLAQCLTGFTGTVTVLAGRSGPPPGPDIGNQLKPFGAAQLSCP